MFVSFFSHAQVMNFVRLFGIQIAELLSYQYTTAESAVMYICAAPKAFECVLLPKQRMTNVDWFRYERDIVSDIVHIPMSIPKQKLVQEGLWLLSSDGRCNSSLLPDLK
ncbi:unnamed protein product [Haemonchus placei]|uniref:Secreted protein n=1 Tax=Haemonchus placei TaxID=6290 RepID=A0A0N4VWE1_HAEPC|nr:unnamed protein product [Haemonchus placei]